MRGVGHHAGVPTAAISICDTTMQNI